MAKLVLLSPGMTGRTHELKADKTTVGRVEDNMFQIPEPSVSSHHCEVVVQGSDVLIRDLNSTNGTYINGEKIAEKVLKPGQILRLGQVEMRLETETPAPLPKKPAEQTLVMQRGVSLTDLEQGARAGFATVKQGFTKKEDSVGKIFWIAAGVFGLVIIGLIVYVFMIAGSGAK